MPETEKMPRTRRWNKERIAWVAIKQQTTTKDKKQPTNIKQQPRRNNQQRLTSAFHAEIAVIYSC